MADNLTKCRNFTALFLRFTFFSFTLSKRVNVKMMINIPTSAGDFFERKKKGFI